jgi:hypothetical protein
MRARFASDFVASLVNFKFATSLLPMPNGQQRLQIRDDALPLWCVLIVFALFPAWVILWGRKETKWTIGHGTSSIIPALRWRVGRFAIFCAVGICVGALFALVGYPTRPHIYANEWSPELFVLPVIATILIVLTRRRIRWHQALLWMALELAGFICFFVAVLDHLGHFLHGRFLWPELTEQILTTGAISFVLGAILLLMLQLRPQTRILGPYCPQCGYCLIGLPTHRCAECGRPFTLEELGIDEAALNPASPLP